MSYKQLIDPNLNLSEEAGLCLQFSRRTFGAPKVEDTAYEAFGRTKYQHFDRNFPDGVSIPVWFEWWGNIKWSDGITRYARYDHVAVRAANGIIYSSPLSGRGQARFNSVDELTKAFGAGMKYYAWTEDISNVRVVEPESEKKEMVTDKGVNYLFKSLLGREADPKQREELKAQFTYDELEVWIRDLPEFKDKVGRAKKGELDLNMFIVHPYSDYIPAATIEKSDEKLQKIKAILEGK